MEVSKMYNDDDYNNYLDHEEWKRQEQEYNDYQNSLFYDEEQARYNSQDNYSSYNGGSSFGGGSLFGGHYSGPLVRAGDAFGEVVFMYIFGFVSLFLASLGSVIWPIIGLFIAFGTIVYDRDKAHNFLIEGLCFLLSLGARVVGIIGLFANISILWQHFFG